MSHAALIYHFTTFADSSSIPILDFELRILIEISCPVLKQNFRMLPMNALLTAGGFK